MSEAEELIVDDYKLVNCIATGNVSQVWEVEQISTSQTFAMKLLLDEALEDAEQRNTMKHEAKVGQSLEHPNIIHMFDSKVSKKQGYIIMEMFKAANLKSMIRGSLLNVHVRMAKLAESVTSAYAYMHEKGWIHKDIKPDNILMTKGSEIRVIDFSLAGKAGSSFGHMVSRKSKIAIQGTRTYIAPELIKRERLTAQADIYSLGITFFECLTGRPPFTGTNPNALLMSHIQERPPEPSFFHKNISPQADALIAKMLAKKPKDRHETMQEVFSELRNVNFFKTDPLEYDRQQQADTEAAKDNSVDQRIDSRLDHEHTQKHGNTPMPPKAKPQIRTDPEAAKPAPAAPAQPAAQAMPQMPQMPPGMMPQMPPGMPPYMYPGMMPPQPGMPYPQMPMHPGMMPPGGYPQGMPGQQPMPGQAMPGQQPMPGQQQPGGQPQPGGQSQPGAQPPQQAPAPPPQQPAAGTPQPPPAAPAPPPPAPAEKPAEAEPETPEDLDWINVM